MRQAAIASRSPVRQGKIEQSVRPMQVHLYHEGSAGPLTATHLLLLEEKVLVVIARGGCPKAALLSRPLSFRIRIVSRHYQTA